MKTYGRLSKIGKDKLQELANNCKSLAGLIDQLGYSKTAGGTFSVVKKYLQLHQIDTSHWTGKAWNKGQQLKDWSQYSNHQNCKKHLITERSHRCELCGLTDWRESPIPLEVHHKDGNRTNNEYDNLQLLCPNCHALTDTWKGRNKKDKQNIEQDIFDTKCIKEKNKIIKIPKYNCLACGSNTSNKKYCSSICYHKSTKIPKVEKRKVVRPSLTELKTDLETMSFVSVGKKYGVSDNCIRKWLRLESEFSTINTPK
jgi:hypothetical protein